MVMFLIALFFISLYCNAQLKVSGKVLDNEGQPITGANVYIKNSYDGTSTDTAGHFVFKTSTTGKQLLVASFIGYKSLETEINLSEKNEPLTLKLTQASTELAPVVITAGTFEAGDSKRSIVLKAPVRQAGNFWKKSRSAPYFRVRRASPGCPPCSERAPA